MFYFRKDFKDNFEDIIAEYFLNYQVDDDFVGVVGIFDTFDLNFLKSDSVVVNMNGDYKKVDFSRFTILSFDKAFYDNFRKLLRLSRSLVYYKKFRLLDDIGKTLGFIVFFRYKDNTICKISSKKGYEKSFKKFLKCLKINLFDEKSLTEIYQLKNKYEKPLYHFKANESIKDSFKKILIGELKFIENIHKKILKDSDVEYLHLYRVILRRLRSLLSEIKSYIDKDVYIQFSNNLKQLIKFTNELRDLDVTLMYICDYCKKYSELSDILEIIKKDVEKAREKAFEDVLFQIKSEQFKDLLFKTKKYVEKIGLISEDVSLEYFVDKKIKKLTGKVIGHNLEQMSDEEIHNLRIEFKRLRYFFEYFYQFTKDKKNSDVFSQLKKAQELLGKNQDIFFQLNIFEKLISKNACNNECFDNIKENLLAEKFNNMVKFKKLYKKLQNKLK